jgi:hypothetical protein
MVVDTSSLRSRRAILFGAVGSVAASVAAAVTQASPVTATNGNIVHVGGVYTATLTTEINATGTNALLASTDTEVAVTGLSSRYGYGMDGYSKSGTGVRGRSDSGYGVVARTSSPTVPAMLGLHLANGVGVQGQSVSGSGPTGPAMPAKTGVYGYANQDAYAVGVEGASPNGRGIVASGGAAQVRLVPSSAATHPSGGATGDLFLDKSARLWLCTTTGFPATWKQIA